jgi:hypothetical protein
MRPETLTRSTAATRPMWCRYADVSAPTRAKINFAATRLYEKR